MTRTRARTAWRHLRRSLAALAVAASVARILILLVRFAGLVGTVDGVANAIGMGAIVAPYEVLFDEWIVQTVLDIVDQLALLSRPMRLQGLDTG